MKRLIATTEGENKLGCVSCCSGTSTNSGLLTTTAKSNGQRYFSISSRRAILSELELLDLKPANDSQSNTEPDKI